MIDAAIARTELMDWQDEMREREWDARSALADTIEKEKTMSWIRELYVAGDRIVNRLEDVRPRCVAEMIEVSEGEEDLKAAQANAETIIIKEAGGEKALGSNAEARKRALTVALAGDADYQESIRIIQEAHARHRLLDAQLLSLRDRLGLIKAALYANSAIG